MQSIDQRNLVMQDLFDFREQDHISSYQYYKAQYDVLTCLSRTLLSKLKGSSKPNKQLIFPENNLVSTEVEETISHLLDDVQASSATIQQHAPVPLGTPTRRHEFTSPMKGGSGFIRIVRHDKCGIEQEQFQHSLMAAGEDPLATYCGAMEGPELKVTGRLSRTSAGLENTVNKKRSPLMHSRKVTSKLVLGLPVIKVVSPQRVRFSCTRSPRRRSAPVRKPLQSLDAASSRRTTVGPASLGLPGIMRLRLENPTSKLCSAPMRCAKKDENGTNLARVTFNSHTFFLTEIQKSSKMAQLRISRAKVVEWHY